MRYALLKIIILIVNISFFAGIVYVANNLLEERKEFLQQLSDQASDAYAKQIVFQLDHIVDDLENVLYVMSYYFAVEPSFATPHNAKMKHTLLKVMQRHAYVMDLVITDMKGTIIHWSAAGKEVPNIQDRAYFTTHLGSHTKELFFGRPQLSKVHHGEYFFALSRAIYNDNDEKIGVFAAMVKTAHLDALLRNSEQKGFHVTVMTPAGQIYASNQFKDASGKYFEHISGMTLDSLSDKTVQRKIHIDEKNQKMMMHSMPTHRQEMTMIITQNHDEVFGFWEKDRRKIYVTLMVSGLFLALLVWFLLFQIKRIEKQTFDIKKNEKHLEHMAKTDHLTGMPNRRAFYERAKSQLQEARERKAPLSIVLMDIDHFKKINDAYGHDMGDTVLSSVASLLIALSREEDMVARYGGEEFILLLPKSTLEHAYIMAERIREKIGSDIHVQGKTRVTLSLGIAELQDDETIDTIIKRADEALYKAKASGRNRTHS